MRTLVINRAVRADIVAAIARAMDHVLSIEQAKAAAFEPQGKPVVELKDRPPGFKRPMPSEVVQIPHGYQANISFEQQPIGLCKHLSISVDTPGRIPNQPAIQMIAEEFGMWKNDERLVWLEEFEPGHHAVNIVEKTTTSPSAP